MLTHAARRGAAVISTFVAIAASAQVARAPCEADAHGVPPRNAGALGGREFADAVAGLSDRERDAAIRSELLAGNLPASLRQLLPVAWHARLRDGRRVQLALCVMPDYLSLGSDGDSLRVPLGLDSALAVASAFGYTLPTRRIVDLIYRAAPVRLRPLPLPAGPRMRSTAYLLRHEALVQRQREAIDAAPGLLTAGHKKDLVLSARLWTQPGRVAIYGWHRGPGAPIQPLSTVHGAHYADYSHGVRLVSDVILVAGQPRSIFDALADPDLAPLLSDEGTLPLAGELLHAPQP